MPTVQAPAKKSPAQAAPKAAAKSAPAAKASAKKAPTKKKDEREVLYPEISISICMGEEAITDEMSKQLLGWRIVPTESEDEYLLKDNEGNKIQCTNNLKNRQLYGATVATLAQEILRGRWKMNCENLIISKYGTILNGQHSLVAIILAVQLYNEDQEAYPFWFSQKRVPVIDKLVAFGCDEDDETVNTMDTCKPRSLADVVYRSEYFADVIPAVRKNLARMLDYSVKLLWFRTGAGIDAYAPKRTHSESLAFINNHPTMLKCVKLIAEEDLEHKISKVISPGTAAGLMYLMATSSSPGDEYHASENPREDLLKTEQFTTAEEFWVAISGVARVMEPLRKALGNMVEESGGGSQAEKMAIIVKAWNAFATSGTITDKDLKLKYITDEDGYKQLVECPVTGGIDVGIPSAKEDVDVSPEEIQRRAEEIKNEALNQGSDANKAAKKAAKKGPSANSSEGKETIVLKTFKDGELLWVTDPDNGEKWSGKYQDHQSTGGRVYVKLIVSKGYAGAGRTMDVNLEYISR